MPDTDPFSYASQAAPVRADIAAAQHSCWEGLARPGTHWSAAERVAIARQVRHARSERHEPPWLRKPAPTDGALPDAAAVAARTLAVDAHRIDRAWAAKTTEALDEGPYVELAGIVAQVSAIDTFREALGEPLAAFPEPAPGAPSAAPPAGVGDIGAFVPMLTDFPGPNVGRALSLVPAENARFFALVGSMYALRDFSELVWDRPLSRPQIELVAARVSAVNECFY